MAQTLDDRVDAAKADLQALTGPQVPVSTDPSDVNRTDAGDQPASPRLYVSPRQRVYIYPPDSPTSQNGGGSLNAVGGGTDPGNGGTGAVGITPAAAGTPTAAPATPSLTPDLRGSVDTGNTLPTASPTDDTNTLLDQRRQQALESLKGEGFVGYTPLISDNQADMTTLNVDQQHSLATAVQDIAAGFNVSLGKALDLPRETVDRGMGMLGLDFMQHGKVQFSTVDAMRNMGIPAYEVENLANKIGRGSLPALATYAALQVAAPSMAANQGVGTAGYLLREVGNWALKHPIAGLWLGQTSAAGGEVADQMLPDGPIMSPLKRFGGELAGGVLPGAAKATAKAAFRFGTLGAGPLIAKGVGKLTGVGIDAISDALPTDLGNAIKKYNPFYQAKPAGAYRNGLINPNFDANRIQSFAKDQIYGAQTYQDKAIENAINSIPTTGNPAQIQSRTHDLLQSAEKISKRIVSGFWDKVPLKAKIKVTDLRNDVIKMRKELVDNDNTRPDVMMDKVMDTVRMIRLPNGTFKSPTPTLTKLRDLQSQIGTAITEERARDAPREGMVRNMARLSEIIDNTIAQELPNNTSIEQARQMSKRHNDLFSRGPINDILSKRRTGDFRVPQADSIDTLLQKTDGLAALKAVQEGVSTYPRIPTTRFQSRAALSSPFAVTPDEKQQLDALVKSAQDSIRASFREAADAGPQKAVAYSVKNEEAIKALGNVAGELAFAAQKVSTALAEKKAISASALAKFAETGPDKAVANLFAQKDPSQVAHQLLISFRGDQDAIEGLRNEVLNQFFYTRGKTNPNILQKMLAEPRYANLLETVLTGEQFGRLTRMVNTAVRIGAEDATDFRSILKSPGKTVGKIIGAMVGRRLETGTMQGPALVSQRVGKWMEQALGHSDPADMLSQAVLDPNWEALLYSKSPTTTKDMLKAKRWYGRIFSAIDSFQKEMLNRLSKDDNDEQ